MVRDINVGQVYQGWYTPGSKVSRRKVVARSRLQPGEGIVDWQEWNSSLEATTGPVHVCGVKAFLRWAKEVYHSADFADHLEQADASPPKETPSIITFGPVSSGTSTRIGITQQSAGNLTPWCAVKVGEVLSCDNEGRLFLAVEPDGNHNLADAMALLDLRTLEVIRGYDKCSSLDLRRVSADITINVR